MAHHRIRAADTLHATVLERVLFAPTAFFDVTPIGRVLNGFSGDILTVDTELSRTMSEFSGVASYVIGAVVALYVLLPKACIWCWPCTFNIGPIGR